MKVFHLPRWCLAVMVSLGLEARATDYLTNTNVYQVPNTPRPDLRTPFVDPVFGSTVTRQTDPSMLTADPQADNPYDRMPHGLRHEYDRVTAFNQDNTKVILTAIGGSERGAWFVYDLPTGKRVMEVPMNAPNGPSLTWSRTDPNKLIGFNGNEIGIVDVSNQTYQTVTSFPQYAYVMTEEEGTFSDDWHYAACFGFNSDFSTADLFCVDLQAKSILGVISNVVSSDLPNWIGISPSGQYVVGMFNDFTKVYDRNMTFVRNLFPVQTHSDFAYDENGDECLVYFAWSGPQIDQFNGESVVAKVRLRDGVRTQLADTHYAWGSHLSGMGTRTKPGWLLISDYKTFHLPAAPAFTNTSAFQQEIFWLKMDGSGEVKRIAHHHSLQAIFNATASDGTTYEDKDYWAEPHSVSSWDASAVGFASVWGSYLDHYDFYTVTGNWWNDIGVVLQIGTGPSGTLTLSWPASATGYVLQSTDSLTSPHWANVTDLPALVGGRFNLSTGKDGNQRFYRLESGALSVMPYHGPQN